MQYVTPCPDLEMNSHFSANQLKYGFDIETKQSLVFGNKILEVFKGREHLSMKTSGVQSKFFALAVSVGLLSLGATLNAAAGQASLTRADGAVTGASAGESLAAGAVLSTQTGGQAVLNINGNSIVLAENSTVSLDILESEDTGVEKVTNVQLTLSAGRIFGRIAQFSSLSKFVVKIPKGTVGIDASSGPVTFDISANGQTIVEEGSVDVVFDRGTGGQSNLVAQNLRANQMFNPATGTVGAAPADGIPPIPTPTFITTRVATPAQPVQPFQFFISPNLSSN